VSRVIVHDLTNKPVDEFDAMMDSFWTINGNPFASGSGYSDIQVPASVAAKQSLQFGRMVLVNHPQNRLLPWVGMLDTPWYLGMPIKARLYNAEYLLNLRCPDSPFKMSGSMAQIFTECIRQINAQEELYVRLGDTSGLPATTIDVTFDQRPFWDQLKKLLTDYGAELVARPVIDASDGNRLYVYLDVQQQVGLNTGCLLHDGAQANIRISTSDSVIDAVTKNGLIINRVIGISGASTSASRKQTAPQLDPASQGTYRLRSTVQQFPSTDTDSTLLAGAQNFLINNSTPILKLRAQIMDIGQAWTACAPGNIVLVSVANIYLPGGIHGWTGPMRIVTMEHQEASGFLLADLFGSL
jgi:hypothetical protein